MFFAAIALRYAFPYQVYQEKQADKGKLLRKLYNTATAVTAPLTWLNFQRMQPFLVKEVFILRVL